GHAFKQSHPATQAVGEVGDFPPHGGFRNGGHLGLAAHGVGNFVNAFYADQGGVHVHGQNAAVAQALDVLQKGVVHAPLLAQRVHGRLFVRVGAQQPDGGGGAGGAQVLHPVSFDQGGNFFYVGGNKIR